MSLNDYLDQLVEVGGATLISIILVVDVKMRSFPPYIYVLRTSSLVQAPHNYRKGSPSLGIPETVN
jgi:hypothetical protein